MYLEQLLNTPAEQRKTYLANLTADTQAALFKEIQDEKTKRQTELIQLEAKKSQLEEEEKQQMAKLAEMGINSYEDLQKEILATEDKIETDLLKYVSILNGEM